MIRWGVVLAALVLAAGCSAGAAGDEKVPAAPATRSVRAPAATKDTSPGAVVAVAPTRVPNTASATLTLLAGLQVKGRAPLTGYDRSSYGPAWTDDNDDLYGHNGCDTRNDVLRRDLVDTSIEPGTYGCVVLTGSLHDPYTATTIAFTRGVGTSLAVQIDHVVALGDSWQTGAQKWSAAKRVDFANDPLNLLAVDGPANESKGDGDAATWLPPNKAFRCAYVARQTAVKARYGLWVTPAEHDAIARVLSSCPAQAVPSAGDGRPAVDPLAGRTSTPTRPSPAHSITPTASTAPGAGLLGSAAHEFENCTDMHNTYPHGVGKPGAVDQTSGVPDTQFVVSAKLYAANSKSDRDGDGIACEAP